MSEKVKYNEDREGRPVMAFMRHELPDYNRDFGHITFTFIAPRDNEPYGVGSGHPLDDLEVSCQYDEKSPEKLYAFSVEYRSYSVNLDWARVIVKTLEKIEKAMQKLETEWGQPADYGAWVIRVMRVLGIEKVMYQFSGHYGKEYRTWSVTDVSWLVKEEIEKGRKAYQKKYGIVTEETVSA